MSYEALAEVVITMAKTTEPHDVLSRDETAARLGISPRTFVTRMAEGRIALKRVPWAKRPKFLRTDVDRLLRRKTA